MDTLTQEPDEEKKAKKKYTIKMVTITSLAWIIIFTIVILSTRIDNISISDAYVSNLTNTSIVQGYMVGYQQCQEGIIKMINESTKTCQLIRANISGTPVELVPTSCLTEKKI